MGLGYISRYPTLIAQPLGIGKRDASDPRSEATRVDAQYQLPGPVIVIELLVEFLSDREYIGVLGKRIHNPYTPGQRTCKSQFMVETYDVVCKCHPNAFFVTKI